MDAAPCRVDSTARSMRYAAEDRKQGSEHPPVNGQTRLICLSARGRGVEIGFYLIITDVPLCCAVCPVPT